MIWSSSFLFLRLYLTMQPKPKPNTCLVSVFFDLLLGQVTKTKIFSVWSLPNWYPSLVA
jgi:hypothetical protein